MVAAIVIATVLTIPTAFADLGAGYTWVTVVNLALVAVAPVVLLAIGRRPDRFVAIVTVLFAIIFVAQLIETALFGGLMPSGLVVIFGLAQCSDR